MNSTLALPLLHFETPSSNPSPLLHFTSLKSHTKSSSNYTPNHAHPIVQTLKTLTKATILIGVTALMASRFPVLPARAETSATLTKQTPSLHEGQVDEAGELQKQTEQATPLSEFLKSNAEAIESLKSVLQQKLQNEEDEEALKVLQSLVAAQPSVTEWKFLIARLLNEMGRNQDARYMFEEILHVNPLSFEALFENALLMDRCGEREAVIRRLQEALDIAEAANKVKEARDVRFIMAQIQFLQKNVEEALNSYQDLSKEDPSDFKPYFCRGMIYSLLDRNEEAREQFAKYRELSPKKFEVEGYLRTPLSRMKLFGSNDEKSNC